MQEIIETGKTVEEATEKALKQLDKQREEVSVEVLEMPVKKLFGSKPAKVKVTVIGGAQPAEQTEEKAQKAPEKAAKTEKTEKAAEVKKEKPAEAEIPASGEKVDAAVEFLTDICKKMGVDDVTVNAVNSGESVILKVNGKDVGVLIGRRGETMEALSYLTGLAANRSGGDYQKFSLDVAGYRSKREQDLAALARRIGAKVAKTGRSHTLEPMNPYERRIIHSAISEMENVKSESIGEGSGRRVVISCTGANAKKGGSSYQRDNRRGGRSNGRRSDYSKPKTEYKPRDYSQEQQPKEVTAKPELVEETIDIGLYGKIEL